MARSRSYKSVCAIAPSLNPLVLDSYLYVAICVEIYDSIAFNHVKVLMDCPFNLTDNLRLDVASRCHQLVERFGL